jgi:quercetin dioxygenase-like cupin family protein
VSISVLDNDAFPWVDVRPGVKRRVISNAGIAPAIGLVQLQCETGTGAPDHIHPYDEIYTVLEGRFDIWAAGQHFVLAPGRSAVVPANEVHGFAAAGGPGLIQGSIPNSELVTEVK